MKVLTIISVINRYEKLQMRLQKDRMELETYRTLEPDEQKEKLYLKKVKYDYEQIGQLLNEEV